MSEHPTASAPPPIRRSLSARLLILTIVFVMLAEVMIFLPSVARYRVSYLQQRLDEANLAALSLLAAPDQMVSEELKATLLSSVGASGVVLKFSDRRMLLMSDDMPPDVDATVDLRDADAVTLMIDALVSLLHTDPRMLRVIGNARSQSDATVELLMHEAQLQAALRAYGWNILTLSMVISIISASMLFLTLRWLMVRPLHRLAENMVAFRTDPESPDLPPLPRNRTDEIGVAAAELAAMEEDLRRALAQKSHLAALGTAVSKISHDLRNILSTAQLVSEFLASSDDPIVKKMAPRLLKTLDRAITLCDRSLRSGSADEPPPSPTRFDLAVLVEECRGVVEPRDAEDTLWRNDVPDGFSIHADREQMFRVLMNLGRNAAQAVGEDGLVRVTAERLEGNVRIRVCDNGGGLPQQAKETLFRPFIGSVRAGGTGLGLAIARDLVTAHGGAIELERTGADGTVFRITLPDA
ncbi:MAG: HAMP domain-containing sensor histidine kinase [Minwuia sp.]|nr:HAMP domain-containing sensor histidine kinase [Minwuia sp.]